MANTFNLGQLTKEMVAARLKALGDPCAAAAEVAFKALSVGLKDAPEAERVGMVRDVCHGTMVGLVLAEQCLGKGAVALLERVGEVAAQVHLDPTEAMMAALHGIADVGRVVKDGQLYEIRVAVETAYQGAGEAFARLLRTQTSGVKA